MPKLSMEIEVASEEAKAAIEAFANDVQDAMDKTSQPAKQHSAAVAGMIQSYTDFKNLAGDALHAVQQAWDAAKEGAQIELQQGRFERLAKTIGTTADALKNDLGAATKGMLSNSEQVQMGTDLMSLGLAKTHDQVVRLSSVAAGLNMDMNQLVLTLANQTTMRFDQLGVSVDGFDERLKKLKDSGMDVKAAFTEAFLEQAEEQMAKLGSASDTTAGKIKIVENKWKDFTDQVKVGTANGLVPLLDNQIEWNTIWNENAAAADRVKAINYILANDVWPWERVQLEELIKTLQLQGEVGMTAQEKMTRAAMGQVKALEQLDPAVAALRENYANLEPALKAYYAAQKNANDITAGVTDKMAKLNTYMAGAVSTEMKSYNQQQKDLKEQAAKIREELDKLEASQGRAIATSKAATMTDTERQAAMAKLAAVQEDLTLQERRKNETDLEFQARMAGLAVEAENLTGKIDGNTGAVTRYVDNSKRIGELKDEYAKIDESIKSNAAEHELATKKILYGFAEQQLAAGGVNTVEMEALNQLAKDFGLIDDKTAAAFDKTMQATQRLAEDSNIQAFKTTMGMVYEDVSGKSDAYTKSVETAKAQMIELGMISQTDTTPKMTALKNTGVDPTTEAVKNQMKAVGLMVEEWAKVPKTVKTVYTIETRGSLPDVLGSGGPTKVAGKSGGGLVSEGLYYLHDDEVVLNRAQRMGREQIPAAWAPGITQSFGNVQIVLSQPVSNAKDLVDQISIELGRRARARSNAGRQG